MVVLEEVELPISIVDMSILLCVYVCVFVVGL